MKHTLGLLLTILFFSNAIDFNANHWRRERLELFSSHNVVGGEEEKTCESSVDEQKPPRVLLIGFGPR